MKPPEIQRVIALGASNLTRGFGSFLVVTSAAWGPELEVFAALGHGRSYGSGSRVLLRVLPGILQSGIWKALESQPARPARALVTDIGNDLLYGFSPQQTLDWVGEALRRLGAHTDDIVLTDLPMASIRSLTPLRYLLFRSILVPACRLSLEQVQTRAETLSQALARLTQAEGLRFERPEADWFGPDPVHIRGARYPEAWRAFLSIEPGLRLAPLPYAERIRLALLPPESRRLCGLRQFHPQTGVTVCPGSRLWLY